MYDIRQFKPTLYLVVLMGIVGYAMASGSAAGGALAVTAVLLNAWLVFSGRFAPMHHAIASVVTLICFLYVFWQAMQDRSTAVLAMAQFLVLLQVVKLFEQRSNRDYAQLLVLSLLLMVAASINTGSLLFGILLIAYLLVALYCCLLFHLKAESEAAQKAWTLPNKVHPPTARQNERMLSASMRRLTGLVSVFSIASAVATFALCPRLPDADSSLRDATRLSQSLTGFSDQVNFQRFARIAQNTQIVAHVTLWQDGRAVNGTQPLLLRGRTMDRYVGLGGGVGGPWRWVRSWGEENGVDRMVTAERMVRLGRPTGEPLVRQRILLEPTGTNVLFAVAGPVSLKLLRDGPFRVRVSMQDESLQTAQTMMRPIEYEVESVGHVLRDRLPPRWGQVRRRFWQGDGGDSERSRSYIDPQVAAYARRADVSGVDAAGRSLAAQRGGSAAPTPLDAAIARNIQDHLHSRFSYTLSLADARREPGQDPMVAFLYELKRGHCEYFAGAMTLMCQSLGMQARMVVGFRSDEFNEALGQYVVRQSHAHAWVEVLTTEGWQTFDPTSGRDAGPQTGGVRAPESLWTRLAHWYDFVEYHWQQSVVAYDFRDRQGLMQWITRQLDALQATGSDAMSSVGRWLKTRWWGVSLDLLSAGVAAVLTVVLGLSGWVAIERSRLKRRADRIGIDALPRVEQARLARQLGFYDELVRLLERQEIRRPAHLTPMEFARSLVYLPNEVYDAVLQLTDVFYRVRFGGAELVTGEQRELMMTVRRVEGSLAQARGGA